MIKHKFYKAILILLLVAITLATSGLTLGSSSQKPVMVLAGSSSMRRWKDAKKVFGSYEVINTAIGGSKTTDWLRLYEKRIVKYSPDVVLFYCGANDIQDGNGVPGIENAQNTIQLLRKIRKKLKNAKIYYISINHCIRNPNAWGEIDASNKLVRQFCGREKNICYINIVPATLLPDGTPNPALFKEDGIHPTKQGFKVWDRVIGKKVNR
jgi:lysophospholipase L1-like esterase